jgi:hypothetical protein
MLASSLGEDGRRNPARTRPSRQTISQWRAIRIAAKNLERRLLSYNLRRDNISECQLNHSK